MHSFNETFSSPPKYLIHPAKRSELIHPKNIFGLPSVKQQAREWQNSSLYSVVGDSDFKRKFVQDVTKTLQTSTQNKPYLSSLGMQSTKDKLNQTTTIPRDTMMSKLSLDKQLRATRDFRSFTRFKSQNDDWSSIDKRLMKAMKKDSTVMKDSFKDLYAHPNPSKIDLINDNIPEYWKHSLRGNSKRLKSFTKGHQFKKQIGEEMLQTLKGTLRLERSIAKIPSSSIEAKNPEKIVLFGFKSRMTDANRRTDVNRLLKSPIKYGSTPSSMANEKTLRQTSFQEVYKIHYKASEKWMGLQNI